MPLLGSTTSSCTTVRVNNLQFYHRQGQHPPVLPLSGSTSSSLTTVTGRSKNESKHIHNKAIVYQLNHVDRVIAQKHPRGLLWGEGMELEHKTKAHLVVSAHCDLQAGHVLPQLPPSGVDLHRRFRDGLLLSGLQVLHFPQHRCQLGRRGRKGSQKHWKTWTTHWGFGKCLPIFNNLTFQPNFLFY